MKSKIRTILDSLSDTELKRLEDAFDSCEPCFITIGPNTYIGVNTTGIDILIEDEKIGNWSLGRIKK